VKEPRLASSVEEVAAGAVDVILKDGGTLRLRPPAAADSEAVLEFLQGLSERSLYLRFHGIRTVDEALAGSLLDPDWIETGALAGWLGDRIVGIANYIRLRDPRLAEAAFVVADSEQGRGIGTRLLEQLAERAAATGVTRFVADVMAANRAMLSVFTGAGFDVVRELEHGEVEVSFPIAATKAFQERVEERDHVAVAASLRPFFEPSSVAVIGASRRRGSIGGELFRNVLEADFAGAAYPVNRGGEPVSGVRGYGSITEIADDVELAVICVPGPLVLEAAEEALAKGVRALCVISSGFAETGAAGVERQEQLLALVRAHGARLLGPNCLGIASSKPKLNATFAPRALPPGRIGFSSQSGALGLALLEQGEGLGFSAFVSIGNKADVSSNDLLEWWEDDPETDVVLLYLESFGNPRKFGRLSRRVARRKPILALKAGATATGAKAASSHTAALAGSEAAVDALFHQAGVLRARTLEELVDVAGLLSSQPLPRGRRVGVLTNAGGLGILCADACEAAGLDLPELAQETRDTLAEALPGDSSVANPVDMLGSATGATYERAIPALLADPRLDALIVLFVPPVVAGAPEVAASIRRAVEASHTDKPVLAAVMSAEGTPLDLLESDVASFTYPESAARALGLAADRAEWLRRPAGTVPELDGIALDGARAVVEAAGEGWLDPSQTRELLSAYGIPLVAERTAGSTDEAVAAAEEIGYPVVVKTAAPGAHKTESGGIALDLQDERQVREAVERITAPVIVQQYLQGPGVELLAGVVQDPVFGPLVAFGPGGVFAELIGDATFRVAPLTDVDAEELVTGGKAGRLVAGFRGSPPADTAALEGLVHRLGRLAEDFGEVAELDLNPVIAGPAGCVAVDARVRLASPPAERALKSW
jgi:acetate---CoA ligase (ADP-forming)